MPLELEEYNSVHGKPDDVELVLDGKRTLLIEQYQVKSSVLTQPSAFNLRIGWHQEASELLRSYPPGTPFQLKINGLTYMTGLVDGQTSSGGATAVTFNGRDTLAALHDAFVEKEFAIKQATYKELVQRCLDAAGLKDVKLAFSNDANRRILTAGEAKETKAPRDVGSMTIESEKSSAARQSVQAQLGERLYELVKRNLDRAGLFLWTAGDGSFVLSEPNPNQTYAYQLIRRYGEDNPSNIISDSFTNNTSGRFSEAVVYGKGGGKKFGRTSTSSSFVDDEMKEWGFTKKLVIKDQDAGSPKKAEYLARRRIAESRRAGRKLTYTVRGHTIIGPGGGRAIWMPDTVVYVKDDKYGIDENFYIEGVTFDGQPQVTTTLDLMRIEDVVFSDGEAK